MLQFNKNLQDSQIQIATSGFFTSTQYPDEQESQVINSLNGSPTQGKMEADDNFNTLNLSGYNNNAAHVNRRLPSNMEHPSLPLRQSQLIQLPSQPKGVFLVLG